LKQLTIWVSRRFRAVVRPLRGLQFWLLRGHQALFALLPRLGFRSTSFGPPKGLTTAARLADDAAHFTLHPLAAAQAMQRRLVPKTVHPTVFVGFAEAAEISTEPLFVLTGGPLRCMGRDTFAFVSEADEVIDDLSFDIWCPRYHPVFRQLFPPARVDLTDTVCAVLEPQASTFGHWLLEMVPRLALAKEHAARWGGKVRYLINHRGARHELETFAAIGIPLDQIERWAPNRCYRAERWIIPSFTSKGALNISPASVNALRDCFLPQDIPRSPKRRLYLSRKSDPFRRVVNEPEVMRLLAECGFECVEPATLSVREQAVLFASAEAVVSVISSGLVNLVFMSPGAKVIEIFPESLFLPIEWALCELCGIDYFYLFEQGFQPASIASPGNRYADIRINLECLKRTLELAGL
jgi:hypothetical protein